MRYIKIVSVGAGIGAFASMIGGWALMVTILFPVVWMMLENKKEYRTLAIGYYIGVSVEDPWLIKKFWNILRLTMETLTERSVCLERALPFFCCR